MTPPWATRVRVGLPLLSKELTELAARRRTYVVRALYAAALFAGFALFIYSAVDYSGRVTGNLGAGKGIFDFLVIVQFGGIYALLPAMMAGVLASEKERDSLVLLLVTDLGPWEIVLQKLLGRLVPMLTFLLLSLPLMTVAYSFGGMSADHVASGVLMLLLTCVQVGTFALMWSAICRTTAQAFVASYAFGALFYLGLPLLTAATSARGAGSLDPDVAFAFMPPFIFLEGTRRGFGDVLVRSIPVAASGGLFLVLARVFLVRRAFAQPKDLALGLFRSLDRFMVWANRLTGGILLWKDRPELPGDEPVAWREVNKKALGKPHYLFRVLVGIELPVLTLAIFVLVGRIRGGSVSMSLSVAVFALWGVAVLAVAVKSASSVVTERARRTMEVLLSTPIEGHHIIRQKMKGLRRLIWVLWVPFLTVILVEAYLEAGGGDHGLGRFGLSGPTGVFTYVASSVLLLVIYPPMFGWAAMWVGLRAKGRSRAVVTVVVALVGWCVVPLGLVLVLSLLLRTEPDHGGLAYLWLMSPVTIIPLTEFAELPRFASFGGVALVPVALNSLWHSGVLFFFRYLCLTHADRHLGRMEGGGPAAAAKAAELASLMRRASRPRAPDVKA